MAAVFCVGLDKAWLGLASSASANTSASVITRNFRSIVFNSFCGRSTIDCEAQSLGCKNTDQRRCRNETVAL